MSERLCARHEELVRGAADLIPACPCQAGCPACTGPRLEPHVDAKALALRLLSALARTAVVAASTVPADPGVAVAEAVA